MKLLREGKMDTRERVVILVTGNGLKNVEGAMQATGKPYLIEPSMDDFRRLMDASGINAELK